MATDNSIYQLTPQAIAFPRGVDDLVRIATLLGEERFVKVRVAPRGGGTGTNGQSLTDGLVVDLSRYMNRILAIDQPFTLLPAEREFMTRAFMLDADGRLLFPESVTAPKQSGKTTLAALIVLTMVLLRNDARSGEGLLAANDFDQAASRVFMVIRRIVAVSPLLKGEARITADKIVFPAFDRRSGGVRSSGSESRVAGPRASRQEAACARSAARASDPVHPGTKGRKRIGARCEPPRPLAPVAGRQNRQCQLGSPQWLRRRCRRSGTAAAPRRRQWAGTARSNRGRVVSSRTRPLSTRTCSR